LDDFKPLHEMCSHCGASHTNRLGRCHVCEHAVCERCGNTQHIQGERKVVHNECLNATEDSFSMIRFVK
jgi:NMD protein affecting ribosome stability and mRNA decay